VTAAEIWAQHKDTMFERVELLERAVTTGEGAEEARTAAHQLAGTVGTFGFPRASALARELERRLDAGAPTPDLAMLVAGVREDLSDPPFVVSIPVTAASLPLVLLATADNGLAERMRSEATRRGLRLTVADRAEDVPACIEYERPGAAVIDLPGVAELDGVPAIVLAEATEPGDRAAFARSGAVALLERTLPAGEVLEQVAIILEADTVPADVLVLADDDLPALAEAGLSVEPLAGPDALWLAQPAPLVLADGVELCRALRTDPDWAAVPIVLLDTDPVAALEAGADDGIAADDPQLGARVRLRLARLAAHQARTETDALSGLPNRRAGFAALGRMVRLAERLDKPLCLARISVAPERAGDIGRLLRRSLRAEDVVARVAEGELLAALFGTGRGDGMERVAALLTGVEARAGVAAYPADGADLEALHDAAGEALASAAPSGRDQVIGAGGEHLVTQQVDVAIVEDEDAISDLISQALTARGYRCWRFSNGAGAAGMLTGSSPQVRARVILLDLNMPAVDGMELLAVLGRDGVLRTSRVIVVSARDSAEAISRAHDLGASEYHVKPVDLPALLETVGETLGRRRQL
jgi:DNA-binding response OmpR family regulator/HPt (histidine-containing phosphotransfer) domain-containing protein